jgi:MFS family permease
MAPPNFPAAWEGRGLSIIALEHAGGFIASRADDRLGMLARSPTADAARREASASARGLDWFAFFLSDVQTGFGPFVAIYLTVHHWAQFDIGLVLTVGGLVGLAAQMPGGALVDAVQSKRILGGLAVVAICASALTLALWPTFAAVMSARVLHAVASCVLGPVIVAISLRLVGHAALGERLGRNARFASVGNGLTAALMGACGSLLSNQAVFFLTAGLVAPALLALAYIRTGDTAPRKPEKSPGPGTVGLRSLLSDRRLWVFAGCILLFQLANAAMLPLMGGVLAARCGDWAASFIGACVVVPQLVVVGIAPWVGRAANVWGRRPLLVLCFAALAVRAALFALVHDPGAVVVVQALDGISAAVLGVLVPLVVADIMGCSGRFNLALGIVGTAVGIGAAMSTTVAGYAMDHFGSNVTFALLASIAGCGLMMVWAVLPETRPDAVRTQTGDHALRIRFPNALKTAVGLGRSGSAASISSL